MLSLPAYRARRHVRRFPAVISARRSTRSTRPAFSSASACSPARRADASASPRPRARATMINLCANNYLGLADHPEVVAAAKQAMDAFGFGMASVRFICGAQTLHRELEQAIARHLGKDDAIVFAACFDANGGVFEPLMGEEDAIISDGLNHASIIDGVRLSKARRYRFANSDMNELEDRLKQAGRRRRAVQADRDRRRLLDGRLCRETPGDLRARRALWRAGPGRRLPRDRASRREGPRHAGADRRGQRASTSSPARSARRSAAAWAASSPRRSRSSTFCASGRGPISSRTRSRRPSPPARLKALEIAIRCRRPPRAARGPCAALPRRHRKGGFRRSARA